MPWTICKRFRYSASHHLNGLPDDHPCGRPHGHNYVVDVTLVSDRLTGPGWVRDFAGLTEAASLIAQLDHRDINTVLNLNPTVENMAEHIYWALTAWYPELKSVRVAESPGCWAEYSE